jgi:small conductance mechanosensitive channel
MMATADSGALFNFTDISGWSVVLALAVVIVGWIVSIFARRGTDALLKRMRGISPEFAALAPRLVKYFVVLLAIGIALSLLGAPLQPILAAAIIVGVILALALRGIADNFASGVVIQTRRPIGLGDEIEVEGTSGTVTELNGRAVVIRTRDGQTIHVPNTMVLQNPLINHSEAGVRRSNVEVRAKVPAVDVARLIGIVTEALPKVPGIHSAEHAQVLATRVSDDRATLTVQFWHHPTAGSAVSSEVVIALSTALYEEKIIGTVQAGASASPVPPPPTV